MLCDVLRTNEELPHSVCLSDKQGRAGARQGGRTFSVTGRYLPGRYLLAAPIRNRAGQGRAGQGRPLSSWTLSSSNANSKQGRPGQGKAVIFIIEHIKKTRIFLKKKKENKYINK
jgi:hypothetical protein